ncbi:MAG: patatin-like phospholipase family protein [Candidatus Fimenecus sp.]
MRPYGLILAGGGAKGAYQIGAWRAMRELGVQIEAIAGVSIGAINGALIAQGDFDSTLELWNNVEVKDGIHIDAQLKSPENLFSFSNLPQIFHEVLKNGGVDVTPARDLIARYVHEEAVRASGIPLGLVTFQLSSMKPVELFLDEIEEGRLIDYLMLSARFPGLQNESPDGAKYLDGGVYDNAPVGMLRKRGINRFIVVDISSMKGIGHKTDLSCADIIYIRPNDPKELGESFEFDRAKTEMRMQMGYLDAKKAFGVLGGQKYYFKPAEYKKMQALYGYKACTELEDLALERGVERLTVYTHNRFMRALLGAEQKPEKEPESDWENLADSLLQKAQPLLDKAPEELVRKIRRPRKKTEKYPAALEALDAFRRPKTE